ncbi:CoA transferase [Variovorax sp. J31P207]|uniref:CaiB/BaiF CoA-transferase family protein n=1 Tax=Variovorax sp. J31P207 TaxID=3053510 RepID=UPI0025782E04|nr:CoA transferase [Variovorax sp. J31P207]MDM0072688.1 CoA transferase [Variovorax sp. J31P207]
MAASPSESQTTLRVVEVASSIAGAACGRLFAALGHDVMKCEPASGDPLRAREFTFTALHAGKGSLVLESPSEGASLNAMLDSADVLILDHESVPIASMAPDRLRQRFPHLVTVSLTAFGLTGEYGGAVGDSFLAEAYGGLANMIGEPDQRPLSLGGEQSAHAAAFVGLYGAMVALRRRAATGRGEYVEVAQSDVAAYIDWKSDVSYSLGTELPFRTGSSRGGWRVVQARDGWIGVIFLAHQWASLVELIGDTRLLDPSLGDVRQREEKSEAVWAVIAEAIAQRDAKEVYASAQRLGLPFGFAADAADLLSCEQLLARGFVLPPELRRKDAPVVGLPVAVPGMRDPYAPAPRLGEHADRTTTWTPAARQCHAGNSGRPVIGQPGAGFASPLGGMLVLDFGAITAGAATGRLLADYGATVVKIESHSRPDPFRSWVSPNGRAAEREGGASTSPVFSSNNVGKRGLCLDLKTERGRQIVHRLIRRADVLVENFRVGVTARMGIDYDTVHRLNPDLVYLSLSSQGLFGIESSYSSYGSTLDLLSGLAAVTGYPGGAPLWSSGEVNYPDQVVSLLGAALVMHAVVVGQGGVHLDVSQREVVAWTLADQLAECAWTGHAGRPNGNRRPGSTPHDTYPATETNAWLAIACTTQGHRQALAGLVGGLPVEAPETWWLDHQDAVDERIANWTRVRSRDQAVAALRGAGVPAVPVSTAADRAEQSRYRERRTALRTPEWLKGFPMILHGFDPPTPEPAPELGEDIQNWNDAEVDAFLERIVSTRSGAS